MSNKSLRFTRPVKSSVFRGCMQHIQIHGARGESDILIGGSLSYLQTRFINTNLIVITDPNVNALYSHCFPSGPVIITPQGEEAKTMESATLIYQQLIGLDADRTTMLIGIGGGIVCDLTGFVASTYMRGISFAFAPTTLLAQVDASVGGKNGVNLDGYKNIVGVFNQPETVLCDLDVLSSLPNKEIGCGLAEIVKHAAIADMQLFDFLEKKTEKTLQLDRSALERGIADSVRIKSNVVNKDEKERGERRKLNFGHTFGHAFETITGLPHGQAVSLGMVMAGALSVWKGFLSEEELSRLTRLLKGFLLPVRLDPLGLNFQCLLQAIMKDKKREGGNVFFVLLQGLGQAEVKPIALAELGAALPSLTGLSHLDFNF